MLKRVVGSTLVAALTFASPSGAFDPAQLQQLLTTKACLLDVMVPTCDLTGANLIDADLAGADLAGADMTRANLTGANLTRANLTRANP